MTNMLNRVLPLCIYLVLQITRSASFTISDSRCTSRQSLQRQFQRSDERRLQSLEKHQQRRTTLCSLSVQIIDKSSSSSSEESEQKKEKPAVLAPADDEGKEEQEITMEDNNGNTIRMGSIIRVSSDGVRAFQVAAKARGYFDDDKNFVATPDVTQRIDKCLRLPVGLRGVVNKMYDVDDISANSPVRAKFVPDEHTEEGYSSPVAFLMHFGPEEIEVVVAEE
mmetsp:Transcript_2565/g.7134  ORF Transcript_2565/g.7134 Transcript_2565/m.7134 type:complete len:223 (-) Transcript_2565:359-1027(-)